MTQEIKTQTKISVLVPDAVKTGVYSNAASVSVNENDVVVDFGYMIPGSHPTQITIVSRINMPHAAAENFTSVLADALLDHRNRKKRK